MSADMSSSQQQRFLIAIMWMQTSV